jgi:bacteriocin-like protein
MQTITNDELAHVTGGFDLGGIAGKIGGMIDKFTGGKFNAAQKGAQIGGLLGSWFGKGGGGGGDGGGAQQGQ